MLPWPLSKRREAFALLDSGRRRSYLGFSVRDSLLGRRNIR